MKFEQEALDKKWYLEICWSSLQHQTCRVKIGLQDKTQFIWKDWEIQSKASC